jgi:branched-chain amino acid transport system substrate-binding protein
VVVASVGTYTGPVGTVIRPLLDGAQVWVRYINDHGGLNGHKLVFLVYDDGGDSARHRAQVQEAVERKSAVAFLMNGEAVTGAGSVEYITAKRIPVIGITGGETWMETSPMYFPQNSGASAWGRTLVPAIARQLPKGKTKLGSMVCVEAPECDGLDRDIAEGAKSEGLNHVYRGRASFTQPDYTAECLAAQNAKADIFFMLMDQNSVGRVATACARQAYRPIYAIAGPSVEERQKDNPNLDGMLGSSNTFPYFQGNTPATAEFQAAMKTYGQALQPGPSLSLGWTAGKLLQKAAATAPEPLTTASLLTGLWSMKGETLGGITAPRTFTEGKPSEQVSCWFFLHLKSGAWTTPDNFAMHCL